MTSANAYQAPRSQRRFHAFTQRFSTTLMSVAAVGAFAVWLGSSSLVGAVMPHMRGPATLIVGILVFGCLAFLIHLQRTPKEVLICVDADAITVDAGTAQPRAFNAAALGRWVSMTYKMPIGTALHLRCGEQRYVIGGQDHRLPTNARLDATPVSFVNAWMTASEFGELLGVAGPAYGLDTGATTPGAPIRCSLYSPSLSHAIDVGEDAIWVTDLRANTLAASAWLAQVSATPTRYTRRGRGPHQRLPAMDVAIPGLPSLGIGCPDGNLQGKPRFAWHRNSRPKSQWGTPQFTVSAADWLTLIEAFGLRAHLEDRGGGALTRR